MNQASIAARIQARIAALKNQRARYIELANKPYGETTKAENVELLELEQVVDSGITIEAAESLLAVIDAIKDLSDVSSLFDGADHLNEYTHEENEKHLIAALDKIHAIASGAKFDLIGGIPVLDDTDDEIG